MTENVAGVGHVLRQNLLANFHVNLDSYLVPIGWALVFQPISWRTPFDGRNIRHYCPRLAGVDRNRSQDGVAGRRALLKREANGTGEARRRLPLANRLATRVLKRPPSFRAAKQALLAKVCSQRPLADLHALASQ